MSAGKSFMKPNQKLKKELAEDLDVDPTHIDVFAVGNEFMARFRWVDDSLGIAWLNAQEELVEVYDCIEEY